MKRRSLLSLILGSIMALSCFGALGCGSGAGSGNGGGDTPANSDYVLNTDHYVLTSYTGSDTVLTIKSEINGIPVTQIAEDALEENQTVTKVIIPDSITKMGEYAFYKCTSLLEVQMGNGITRIATSAFEGCSKLKTVKFPSELTSIGKRAFYNCPIEEINLPSNLKTINEKAFSKNKAVKIVSLPESLTSLLGSAFEGCTALESLTLNAKLEEIATKAFRDCPNLKTVNFAMDGDLEIIGDYAFEQTGVEQLKFPDSVKAIKNGAFYNCSALRKVEFGKKIVYIGGGYTTVDGKSVGVGAFGDRNIESVHIVEMIFPNEAMGTGWFAQNGSFGQTLSPHPDHDFMDRYYLTVEELKNNEAPEFIANVMTGYSWFKNNSPVQPEWI